MNKVMVVMKDGRVRDYEGADVDCGSMDGAVMIRRSAEDCDVATTVFPLADVEEITYLIGVGEAPALEVVE